MMTRSLTAEYVYFYFSFTGFYYGKADSCSAKKSVGVD